VTRGEAPLAIAIVSGGLDSSVLAHHLVDDGWRLQLVSFDYGQRHAIELDCARTLAHRLGVRHDVVDLTSAAPLLRGSALTDNEVDVPDGHYTDESMRLTVVPNRNAIFLAFGVAAAVAAHAAAVAVGIHAGDHPIYPDCRPAFVDSARTLARVANEGFVDEGFDVLAPFLTWSKADIVRRGAALGVSFRDTWSCYRGGARHCGTCGTCVERREAFALASVDDPTEYEAAA
jgi:7-cyano-7-deazaguanine synthase